MHCTQLTTQLHTTTTSTTSAEHSAHSLQSNSTQPQPAQPVQNTTRSNTGLVLLMMFIMMPETCWDRSLIINIGLVASCWFISLHPKIKFVLIFSTNIAWNISHSKNYSARCYPKFKHVVVKSIRRLCHILKRLEFSWPIFEKS